MLKINLVNIKKALILLLISLLTVSGFTSGSLDKVNADSGAPDTIYYNGKVITMEENEALAEAVAVKDGKIISVGTDEEINALQDDDTRKVDLGNNVLLPGFYDAHSHFPTTGYLGTVWVDLQSPPVGPVKNIEDLIAELKEEVEKTPEGEWITGFGYDQTLLAEGRHPTRYDLDKVSTKHPIYITHTSGHMGVANSLALEQEGITKDTPNPPGGVIEKDPKTGEPTGLLQESAAINPGWDITGEEQIEVVKKAVQDYASAGVTTSIIAGGSYDEINQYNEQGLLPFRFTVMSRSDEAPMPSIGDEWVRPGGIKITHDGSIQGYTGYLTEPYYVQPEGESDFRGFPLQSREELTKRVVRLHKKGYQIAIHGNGDAAIDDILHAFRTAQEEYSREDARHRIEHAQMARADQIDEMKELGIAPSYFVSHTFYWGDAHRDIFMGPERAANMSPLQWTIDRDVTFSIHLDSYIVPMSPLQAVWSAVNRLSRSNEVIGPDQRIKPMEALRSVTIDAAWQNFDEEIKGSIEPGKYADFVILEEDPLTINPEKIKDIQVLETIVNDETIYKHVTADDMKETIDRLSDDGDISDAGLVRLLKTHLTSISHYESKGAEEKIVKHMEDFQEVLKVQNENGIISDEAYETLMNESDHLTEEWKY